jgi:hypothetical protein
MNTFNVDEIIDGDTFTVNPRWISGYIIGNTVRPTGYNAPEINEPGYQEATNNLRN